MTLIAGMNLGSYAIVAADTRMSYYINDIFGYRDDGEKIRNIDPGIISGAGLASLLDAVKERLDDDQLGIVDRIADLVRGEVAYARQQPYAMDPRVAEAIEMTAWMFTYVGTPDPDDLSTAVLRLALTVPSENHWLASVAANDVWLLPPTGTTDDQFWTWKRRLKSNLQPITEAEDFPGNLQHHLRLIGELMQDVSAVNRGVAPTFQVGIHIFPRTRLISNVIRPGEGITWKEYD
jgi:hypothetical protein